MSRYHYSKAVKFYFKGERRRFQVSVPWEGTGVFLNLKNTIAFHFKDISMAKLNLFWKDAEGDMFSLRSDEDVKIALKDSDNSKLLRVYSCGEIKR